MATAAPAAPSTAAAPSEPTQGQGSEGQTQQTPQTQPENKPEARPIRPIPPGVRPGEGGRKPIIRLPGVFTHEDGAEHIPSIRPRGPDGRFAAGDKPAAPEGANPADKPADKPTLPGEEQPDAAPKAAVKFLGKEYKDIAEVEQLHRTLQGQHRAQLDSLRRITDERDYGYRAANAWIEVANQLKAELEQLKGGKSAPTGQATSPSPTSGASAQPQSGDFNLDEALKSIDTDAFEMIAVNPQGGLPAAARYLIGEVLRVVNEGMLPRIMSQVNQRFQPIEAGAENQAIAVQQQQVFDMVASLKDYDGNVAFPELADEKAVEQIGKLWGKAQKRLGFSDQAIVEQLTTPEGLIQALSLYRTMNGFIKQPAATVPSAAPAHAAPAPGAAASVSADPAGTVPRNGGRLEGSPETARLLRALDQTELRDPVLGFARNK